MVKNEVTIIIPAFNEADNLNKLLSQWLNTAKGYNCEIVIVNDGSSDVTKDILANFKSPNLKVLHHKRNKGYGSALKTGIRSVETKYAATMDADGQHNIEDIFELYKAIVSHDADLVIGSRTHLKPENLYREIGKWIIRRLAAYLLPMFVKDLNSGMKIFNAEIAKKYLSVCPDSMAFSDIFTLIFIKHGELVLERPITLNKRLSGESSIGTRTAFETIWEILNITMFFSPIKIFLTLSVICLMSGVLWEIPILLAGRGVSVGASLLIISGILFLSLGLIAEQLSFIMKRNIE